MSARIGHALHREVDGHPIGFPRLGCRRGSRRRGCLDGFDIDSGAATCVSCLRSNGDAANFHPAARGQQIPVEVDVSPAESLQLRTPSGWDGQVPRQISRIRVYCGFTRQSSDDVDRCSQVARRCVIESRPVGIREGLRGRMLSSVVCGMVGSI